ncbi:MAG: hypothetical protein IJQ65_05865, partial [Kiritimatiellae bacterium]|nr:hypothetical protein [Kiritimatiellia bacterium]
MANKPLYYGSSSKPSYGGSPAYYGKGPAYYGKGPTYYGAGRSYGTYGSPQYGGGGGADDGSIVGTITIGRMMRVVSQRWLSVFVFLLVGLVVAFVVYRISPTIYEARSEFTLLNLHTLSAHRDGKSEQKRYSLSLKVPEHEEN